MIIPNRQINIKFTKNSLYKLNLVGGNIREDFEQLETKISVISPKIVKEFVKLYFALYPENIQKYKDLTQKQRLFYGIKEGKE